MRFAQSASFRAICANPCNLWLILTSLYFQVTFWLAYTLTSGRPPSPIVQRRRRQDGVPDRLAEDEGAVLEARGVRRRRRRVGRGAGGGRRGGGAVVEAAGLALFVAGLHEERINTDDTEKIKPQICTESNYALRAKRHSV